MSFSYVVRFDGLSDACTACHFVWMWLITGNKTGMISQVDEDVEDPLCDANISVLTEFRLIVGGCWEPPGLTSCKMCYVFIGQELPSSHQTWRKVSRP